MKYNLTFWQRFWLPLWWLEWALTDKNRRKTWHEVKKGMEKHVHNFTIPHNQDGLELLMCDHEGCRCCDIPGGEDPLVTYYADYWKKWREEYDREK